MHVCLLHLPRGMQGIATLIADGISMGLGEYLSGRAEMDYFFQDKARELWEIDNNPDGT